MYAPKGGAPEWIELYNVSAESVNVKNWEIEDRNLRSYSLTATDYFVPADSYLVLTHSDTIFSFYSSIPSRVLICPALPASFMANSGDTISIHNSTGTLVDSVFYKPSWGGSDGKSLERISPDASPFLQTSWASSIDSTGSTPGRRNSIFAEDYDLGIDLFTALASTKNHIASFEVTVRNRGCHPTSPFDVNIFLDYNGDSLPDANELVAGGYNEPGLLPGDSLEISIPNVGVANKSICHDLNAIACLVYLSDQDTSNNRKIVHLKFAYGEQSCVVNEIMYAPKKPEPEWVELYNASDDTMLLEGFMLSDNSNTNVVITAGNATLVPNGFVAVAHDSNFLTAHPTIRRNVLIAPIPPLNNTGDAVVIHDACGDLIDSVSYSPAWGGNTGGKSLERILPGGGSNDPLNFETSIDSSGSTPGEINSLTPRKFDIGIGTVKYYPCPLQSGEDMTVTFVVKNCGLEISGNASVILFNDRNSNGECDIGELVDSAEIAPMDPSDSAVVTLSGGKLSAGSFRFEIMVRYGEDGKLSNNTATIQLMVGLPVAAVIINEIMYAPKSPEQEWIELYNASSQVVDLSGFKIETHGGSAKIKSGSVVAPQGFAVICKDSSVSRFHLPVSNLILQSIPSLSNSGDWVALYDDLGNLLDSIDYVPSYGGSSGKSLERIDCFAGSDSTNWHESVDSTGATPGAVNSTAILPFDISLKRLECPGAIDIGNPADIVLVIENVGRNATGRIECSADVTEMPDDASAFSDKRSLEQELEPGDSTMTDFLFSPSHSGTFKVLAKISQQEDQRQRNDTASADINVRFRSQSVVINEIMYFSGKMGEYFEIYNTSPNQIDISDWTFRTASAQSKSIRLSSTRRLLMPGNYFVIAADSSIEAFLPDTSRVEIVKSLTLRDDGGYIVIADPAGTLVDSVGYLPSWQNGDIANVSGRSLEKVNPALPSNDRASWSTCVSAEGGTPGRRNSLFIEAANRSNSISVAPNPFSPDGDGHDDFTFVNYSFPVSSVKVRVRIFDSIGRLIATPEDNAILPSSGSIVWDGRDGSGRIVKFGLYILFVEVTGPDGRSLSTYKKPLVVAKRMR